MNTTASGDDAGEGLRRVTRRTPAMAVRQIWPPPPQRGVVLLEVAYSGRIMIGRVLSDEFFEEPRLAGGERGRDRDPAAAGVPIMAVSAPRTAPARGRQVKARGLFTRTALVLGLAFLYLPILSMMVYSFNNSRLVTVWDAAHSPTLKWYVALLSNEQILRAAWLSIRIAVISASAAVVLARSPGWRWRASAPFAAACCWPA